MSAIAACWRRDGRDAVPADLAAPIAAAAHRAGGPFHVHCGGPAALASTTPPVLDRDRGATVIVDGLIDNLDDLAQALGVHRDAGAVVLAAFDRWGFAAGAHLLGDFVVAIYESRRRRLTCIRDPMGQRPLFYGLGRDAIILASEAQQIVRHPEIAKVINEAMVAEHLTDAPATMAETLWRDVYRVPPGHAIEISTSGPRVHRYWDLDPRAAAGHDSDGAYADEFRDLFTRAIECRIRGVDRVGVLLSGGVDSSSIASLGQALRARAGAPPLHAFSATFPGRPCDETPYIDAVVEKWGLPATRLDVVLASRPDLEDYAERYLDVPMTPGLTADVLRRRAAAMDVRTLLTGCGGDDFFSGSPVRVLESIRSAGVIGAARAAISPLLSDRMRAFLRPMFGARPAPRRWIRPEFARRVGVEDRLLARTVPSFSTREQRDIYSIVRGLPQVLGDEIEDRAAHAAGVTQRHPFYDRRVAEFGFALPPAQRMQSGRHKAVIRRALHDYLPAAIAERGDKAEFSYVYVAALEAIGVDRLLTRLECAERGWVEAESVRAMHGRMRGLYSTGDEAYIELALQLWAIAALELWLARVSSITAS